MSVPNRLILASESPRRKVLLAELVFDFEVQPAGVQEISRVKAGPEAMVLANAEMKAEAVADRNPGCLVLGADTNVFLDGEALNKPADLAESGKMLRKLSGRMHSVLTGLVLRRKGEDELLLKRCVESRVYFKKLDEKIIEDYLSKVNTLDKAGAYAIQENGDLIIERMEGSFSNIVGLPLEALRDMLSTLKFPCREGGK